MNILMHTLTLNVGENVKNGKSNPRIWIELAKEKMQALGIRKGDQYNRLITSGVVTVSFNAKGKYKVAGTDTRAIFDMLGKFLTKNGFKKGDKVSIQFYRSYDSNSIDHFTISKVA